MPLPVILTHGVSTGPSAERYPRIGQRGGGRAAAKHVPATGMSFNCSKYLSANEICVNTHNACLSMVCHITILDAYQIFFMPWALPCQTVSIKGRCFLSKLVTLSLPPPPPCLRQISPYDHETLLFVLRQIHALGPPNPIVQRALSLWNVLNMYRRKASPGVVW